MSRLALTATGSRSLRTLRLAIVMLAVAMTWPVIARAGTGGADFRPMMTPGGPKHGITLEVDTYWVANYSIRPLRFTFKAVQPEPADRTIHIECRAGSMLVKEDVLLAAGETAVSARVAVPIFEADANLVCQFAIDGAELRELAVNGGAFNSMGYLYRDTPTAIILGNELASWELLNKLAGASNVSISTDDERRAKASWPQLQLTNNFVASGGGRQVNDAIAVIALDDMPRRWVELSAIDLVIAAPDQLDLLAQNHPDAWQTLRHWIAAGGTLIVLQKDVAAFQGSIDKLFPARSDDSVPVVRWSASDLTSIFPVDVTASANVPVNTAIAQATRMAQAQGINIPPQVKAAVAAAQANGVVSISKQSASTYLASVAGGNLKPAGDYLLGKVVAIPPDEIDSIWSRHFGPATVPLQRWHARYGLNMEDSEESYWSMLIADVGLPPVNSFRFLITILAIVIGPLNYYLLKRWKRLYLLLFTVPLAALLVTLSLMLFAIFGDGFATKLRMRSLTVLDQRNGQATSWARHSYFAGMAPKDGLRFSDETLLLPLARPPVGYRPNEKTYREMTWADGQQLDNGWIKSRDAVQYVAVKATTSPLSIDIVQGPGGLAAENKLGCDLGNLIVVDDAGALHMIESLPAGAKAELKPSTPALLLDWTRRNSDAKPVPPPNFSGSGYGGYSRRYYGNSNGPQPVDFSKSIMERRLEQLGECRNLPPRSYVAEAKARIIAEPGVEDPVDVASFHVIEGRW